MRKLYVVVFVLIFGLFANSVYAYAGVNIGDNIESIELDVIKYLGKWSIDTFCIKAEGRCIDKENLSSSTVMQIYADGNVEFDMVNGDVGYLRWEIIDDAFVVKDPEFGDYKLVHNENDNIVEDNNDFKTTWYQEDAFEIKADQNIKNPAINDYKGRWTLVGLGSDDVFRKAVFFEMEGLVEVSEKEELSLTINGDTQNNVPFELKEGKIHAVFSDGSDEDTGKPAVFTLLLDGTLLMSFETETGQTLILAFERETPKPTELE